MNKSRKRILSIVGILFSLFFLPVWFTALLCLGFCVIFSNPYEAVAAGYMLDVLYGIPGQNFIVGHIFLLVFLIVFLLSFWIREHLSVGL